MLDRIVRSDIVKPDEELQREVFRGLAGAFGADDLKKTVILNDYPVSEWQKGASEWARHVVTAFKCRYASFQNIEALLRRPSLLPRQRIV